MAALREAAATTTRLRVRVKEEEEEEEEEAGKGRGASSDEITQTGEILLRGLIQEQVERSGDSQTLALSRKELGGPPQNPPNSDTNRLIECVRRIGDELDQNAELQSSMEKVGCEAPKELFFKVATGIFADGTFNWGRVVALLYFGVKLVVKALYQKITKMVKTIVGWSVEFLRERVWGWIKAQGGWKNLLSSFITAHGKSIITVATGALMGAIAAVLIL